MRPTIGAHDCACAVAVRRPRWRQPARRGSTLAMVRAVKSTFSRLFAEERRGLRSQPGPCTSLYTAAMKAVCDRFFFYIGSFRWNTRREKAARVNRILPRFSRARKGAVHRFKRRRGTRIESGINCFLCTAKEAS